MRFNRVYFIDIILSIIMYLIIVTFCGCIQHLPKEVLVPYLISPKNEDKSLSLMPTFHWNSQLQFDIDVKYDFYLGKLHDITANPNQIAPYMENISGTVFDLDSELEKNCEYSWFVVAKIEQGEGTTFAKSQIFSFTTGSEIILEPKYFLITVGVGDYTSDNGSKMGSFKDLSGAPNDAKLMAKLYSKFNEAYHITSHVGYVTLAELKATFSSVGAKTSENDLLVFHFSGHGDIYNENSFLVFSDYPRRVRPKEHYESDKALSATLLKELLDPIAAKKLIVIDACYAGSFPNMALSSHEYSSDSKGLFDSNFVSVFSNEEAYLLSCKKNSYQDIPYHIITSTSTTEQAFEVNGGNGLMILSYLDGLGYNRHEKLFDYSFDADKRLPYKTVDFNELVNYLQNGINKIFKELDATKHHQSVSFYPPSSTFPITSYFNLR